MLRFSFLSAFAAGLFALSSLTADDAAAQPVPETAPAAEATAAETSAAQPAVEATAAETSAAPAVEAEPTVQPSAVGEPAPDPASTVNEKEDVAEKKVEKKPVYKASKLIPYLILTSNYATPLFLAETAQKKTKCPVIVVPEALPFPEKGTPLTVRMPGDDTVMIRAEDLSRFLAYLRPRNVIILGNSDVVPPIYSLAVPSGSKLIQVDDRAWKVNAIRLDDLLNTSPSIYHAYRTYNKQRMIQAEKAREGQQGAESASGK